MRLKQKLPVPGDAELPLTEFTLVMESDLFIDILLLMGQYKTVQKTL